MIPLFDLAAQNRSLGTRLDETVRRTVEEAAFIGGAAVADFEAEFARFLGSPHVVSCASGTDALEVALEALGLAQGDEVIVPAMTWVSTAEAVARIGCVPVFADVLPDEATLDPAAVERAITGRTRAILPVHLYGRPARMDRLSQLCEAHDLLLIEDCAQAHGAMWGGERLGAIGDAAIFSFFPTKNLGALGDGGAMAFRDHETAHKARLIASHGQEERHRHVLVGRNSRLDALQAGVLSVKLPLLDGWIERKNELADRYREALAGLPLTCAPPCSDGRHGWHLFTLTCERRDALRAHLAEDGVQAGIHYPRALTEQPAFRELGAHPDTSPVALDHARRVLSLPLFPELPNEQADRIAGSVRAFFA